MLRIAVKNRGCGVPPPPREYEVQLLLGGWGHVWAYLCVQKNRGSLEWVLLENIGIQMSWAAAIFFFSFSVLGENSCYVLWLGFGLNVVSFKNKSMLSKLPFREGTQQSFREELITDAGPNHLLAYSLWAALLPKPSPSQSWDLTFHTRCSLFNHHPGLKTAPMHQA